MYQFKSRVRYSETGVDARLSLMGIMNYMQDCSTFQSEDCGVLIWKKKIVRGFCHPGRSRS